MWADRFTLNLLIKRQVLTLLEGEGLRQVRGHIEDDGHAIGISRRTDAQIMETVRHGVRISE